MKIDTNEPIREELARELVNVTYQYRQLRKNHNARIRDQFKQFRTLLICAVVIAVLYAATMIAWGFDLTQAVIGIFLLIVIVFTVIVMRGARSLLDSIKNGSGYSSVILDETGIELGKRDSSVLKTAWGNILFVRVFSESVIFIPKELSGVLISVDIKHAKEITGWIKENRPEIELIQ